MTNKMTLRKDITITLATVIPADRHLVIDLPADAPVGPAEIRISIPVSPAGEGVEAASSANSAREIVHTKLRTAGRLADFKAPASEFLMTDEELWELTKDLSNGQSVDDIMKDIRGDW